MSNQTQPSAGSYGYPASMWRRYGVSSIVNRLVVTKCPYCRRDTCVADPCSTELHRRADKARVPSSSSGEIK